jgi:hypothetical protein
VWLAAGIALKCVVMALSIAVAGRKIYLFMVFKWQRSATRSLISHRKTLYLIGWNCWRCTPPVADLFKFDDIWTKSAVVQSLDGRVFLYSLNLY